MKRKLLALFICLLMLVVLFPTREAAAADNPFDKQDNKEVAYSGGLYFGLSASETESAPIKPNITVSKKTLDTPTNDEIAITFSVNASMGTARYWGPAGLYVGYDTRLTLKKSNEESFIINYTGMSYNVSCPSAGVVFIAFSGAENRGCDQDIFSLVFTLPSDAKAGDLYPIGIFYGSGSGSTVHKRRQ